jgi:capsular polysaccharide transport system permease protein
MTFTKNLATKARRNPWFLLGVVLPVLASALYFFLIASEQYVSESRFVIKAPNQRGGQISTFANLIQTTGLSAGQEQADQVIDYVRSRSALEKLKAQFPVKRAYGADGIDIFSRFPLLTQEDAFEDLYKYYQGKVQIDRDPDTGLVVLRTLAFTAKDARAINERLLRQSEALVNELNRAQIVDPLKQATGVVEIANRLISERAALEAQLRTLERLTPENPSIPALRQSIASLTKEIDTQTARLVGNEGAISAKLPAYEALEVEQEFATQLLAITRTSLEQARAEALKQQFYLERVVNPNQPDLPEYPHAWRMVLTIFGFALCLYFIIWMFVVGILEHAPED